MQTGKKALVREKGSIIVTGKAETLPKVEAAYAQAEKEQWNTQQERQEGKHCWTGDADSIVVPEEMNAGGQGVRWNDYCSGMNPKWTKGEGPIIPTRPPHPIGTVGRKTQPEQTKQMDWQGVIGEWVEGVRKEDGERARQNPPRKYK